MDAEGVEPPPGHQGLDLVAVVDQSSRADVAFVVGHVEVDVFVDLHLVGGDGGHGVGQPIDQDPDSQRG